MQIFILIGSDMGVGTSKLQKVSVIMDDHIANGYLDSQSFWSHGVHKLGLPLAGARDFGQHLILYLIEILQEAISGFYRFIWNLFYAEYAIFPFV
ncbi:hypothetical protein Golob_015330 [Gossypium lobatum]|uniref:Uncharacterized protein n=1 Tax=Gossypium lobatum TaxID=34289 RepID=A0A7J8M0T3_9ROSI|nr:hypothetical protein [Gossypium lobatum]